MLMYFTWESAAALPVYELTAQNAGGETLRLLLNLPNVETPS